MATAATDFSNPSVTTRPIFLFALLTAGTLLAGCVSTSSPAEQTALKKTQHVAEALSLDGKQKVLPTLRTDSSPDDFLRYALLKHPAVRAAFHDWHASAREILPARSLPDPQLTFEADIADMVMTLMPGVMFDFMAPGKRAAMGREATAVSEVAYRNYVTTVLRTAAGVRKAWIELAYVEQLSRLRDTNLALLDQSLAVAGAEYATSKGMATFEGQVRALNSAAQVRTEIAALNDRKMAARARFKAALGLTPEDTDPVWPAFPLTATALPSETELWARAQAGNAEIATMRAMVEMTVAAVEVAKKAGTPDFALGAMADLKADPLMVRPTASVTLPIWRKKIAATVAAAEARREGAVARLNAERLNLAAEIAQMLYMVREAERMTDYIEKTALPNLDRAIASAGASYQSGMASPTMIPELRVMAVGMQVERLAALRERENAVTDLLQMVAAVAPAGAPLADISLSDDAR